MVAEMIGSSRDDETHSRDGSRDDRKYGSEVAEMVAEMIGSSRDDLKNIYK